jgi:hypothetical protein
MASETESARFPSEALTGNLGAQTSDKLVETEPSNPGSPDKPAVSDQPPAVKPTRKHRRWRIVVGILVAAVLLFIGIPRLIRAFNTVSTAVLQVCSRGENLRR